jgi:CubicO group peptidase (beta-lactamase class C family)
VIADIVRSGVPSLYPGAVALAVRSGVADDPVVVGDAVRYSTDVDELPAAERVSMRADTLFDIASLTKLFTATVLLSLTDDGALSLSDKASRWLPELDDRITVRHLLTHTSGLPGHIESWKSADSRRAVLTAPPIGAPGAVFEYSCLGYICAGWIAESVTGKPLPELVTERVCRPLGLADTGYWPSTVDRVAATEYEPYVDRGMVRGTVHDENSWRLGGGVGNAGIFSTAADLARFGEMLRLGGAPILSAAAYAEMTTDQLPATLDPGYRQGIGPRIDDPSFMGTLAGSGAIGHTGFTGTSLVVDRGRELVIVFLTNRVHPSRERSSVVEIRQQLADACR